MSSRNLEEAQGANLRLRGMQHEKTKNDNNISYFCTMKKAITFILTAICTLTNCKQATIKDGETYDLWAEMHESFNDENGFEICRNSLYVNTDLIKSLPTPVKTIIARYSVFMPNNYNDEPKLLAQALGNFATLEEAQQILLKDWNCEEIVFNDGEVNNLRLKQEQQSFSFTTNESWHTSYTTRFYIEADGTILCQVTTKTEIQFNLWHRLINNKNEKNQ